MTLLLLACSAGPGKPTVTDPGADCSPTTWYLDGDGDGVGGASTVQECFAPAGYVADAGDCDDADAGAFPGATEACDSVDDDCDGLVDEDLPPARGWFDADMDGYGDAEHPNAGCALAEGYVADGTDCDDTDPAVNPAAPETCNGYDDDCDGLIDMADSPVYGVATWNLDADGDGYGSPDASVTACDGPEGYVADGTDCDDEDAAVNPAATEICLNLVDENCNGPTDDYSGACEPTLGAGAGADAYDDPCDPAAVPVDATACGAGVAAVLPSGASYGTVQAAMDAATAGDVITVCTGTWTEDLVQHVSPLVIAGYGSSASVLAGAGGTVVDMGSGNELTLVDVSVSGGDAESGAGLLGEDATLCVSRTTFADNTARNSGGGISLTGTGALSMDDVLFHDNAANTGGAVQIGGAYTLLVTDSVVSSNIAEESDGGMGIDSTSSGTIANTTFSSNSAGYSTGALSYGGRGPALELDLTNDSFLSNYAGYSEGAVSIGEWDYPTVVATSCLFDGNSADYAVGAVNVGSWDGAAFLAVNTTFRGNSSRSAGAVYVGGWGDDVGEFEDCTFDANTASEEGGAMVVGQSTGTGTTEVTVTGCTFTSNTSGAVDILRSPRALLRSVTSDWGSGATDNTPSDVAGYSYGAAASFTCTDGTCR